MQKTEVWNTEKETFTTVRSEYVLYSGFRLDSGLGHKHKDIVQKRKVTQIGNGSGTDLSLLRQSVKPKHGTYEIRTDTGPERPTVPY